MLTLGLARRTRWVYQKRKIMGLFKGVDTAKMTNKLPPLTAGSYKVRIDRCTAIKVFKTGGNAFIAELEILETSGEKDATGRVVHPVGAKRSWYQKMEPAEIALGSLKSFASSFLGVDPRDQGKVDKDIAPSLEADLDKAISPENGFAGLESYVQVDAVKTKENKDFNRHTWSPIAA